MNLTSSLQCAIAGLYCTYREDFVSQWERSSEHQKIHLMKTIARIYFNQVLFHSCVIKSFHGATFHYQDAEKSGREKEIHS